MTVTGTVLKRKANVNTGVLFNLLNTDEEAVKSYSVAKHGVDISTDSLIGGGDPDVTCIVTTNVLFTFTGMAFAH